jgi:two-component system response regulator (stage 0 sporulation protein F)
MSMICRKNVNRYGIYSEAKHNCQKKSSFDQKGAEVRMYKKILVVDDQYGIRVLLKEVFAKDDLIVFQAANGKQALEIIRIEQPDLILLDMKMPGMDGLELLRRLRRMDVKPKVIMMTAYGELDMVDEATKLGALGHFTKPFDIEELRMAVIKQLVS